MTPPNSLQTFFTTTKLQQTKQHLNYWQINKMGVPHLIAFMQQKFGIRFFWRWDEIIPIPEPQKKKKTFQVSPLILALSDLKPIFSFVFEWGNFFPSFSYSFFLQGPFTLFFSEKTTKIIQT